MSDTKYREPRFEKPHTIQPEAWGKPMTPPDDLEAEVRGLLPCECDKACPWDGTINQFTGHEDDCLAHYWPAVLAALRKQRDKLRDAESRVRGLEGEQRQFHLQLAEAKAAIETHGTENCHKHGDKTCADYVADAMMKEADTLRDQLRVATEERDAALERLKPLDEGPVCTMAEYQRVRDQLIKERDKYHDALIARHGGEPVALLSELDEARDRLAHLQAALAKVWEALEPFVPGADWGKWKAWLVAGAPDEVGMAAAKKITSFQVAADEALAATGGKQE